MDAARKETDLKLARMERKLKTIYSRANKELGEKLKEYLKELEPQEKALKEAIEKAKTDKQREKAQKAYENFLMDKTIRSNHYKALSKQMAGELSNVNKTATAYINGQMPSIYTVNYNGVGEDIASQVKGYTFDLVDASTVRTLATKDETLLPYKTVDGRKDVRWNTKAVNNEVLQGILQGESIPDISRRLSSVTQMNLASAVRNARTSTTAAENRGRMDSYHRAEKMGIKIVKVWMAANDGRTRDAHLELDGQEREIDEPFEVDIEIRKGVFFHDKIMYPGDPNADPANVYNCRCTMITRVLGFEKR